MVLNVTIASISAAMNTWRLVPNDYDFLDFNCITRQFILRKY